MATGAAKALRLKQDRLLAALLEQPTITEACTAADVSRTTAYRWLRESEFTEALKAAETERLQSVTRYLTGIATEAVTVLRDTMQDVDAPAAVRLRAADAVLARVVQLRSTVEMEERLKTLEAAMAAGQLGPTA